jgi:hypothetical protein
MLGFVRVLHREGSVGTPAVREGAPRFPRQLVASPLAPLVSILVLARPHGLDQGEDAAKGLIENFGRNLAK